MIKEEIEKKFLEQKKVRDGAQGEIDKLKVEYRKCLIEEVKESHELDELVDVPYRPYANYNYPIYNA